MAFRTPVDYGFAQVIDNSGLVNAYAQQQLQRNKEAQLQQKEVADQLAKINTNGIKEADIPHINTKFDALRDLGNQARMAAGTSQALQKQAEFDKAAREMSYDIEQSKASNQLYQDRLKFYGEHNAKGGLDPDYMTRVSAIKDIPTFSPDYKTVTSDIDKLYTQAPQVNLSTEFEKMLKTSTIPKESGQVTRNGQRMVTTTTGVDPSTLANKLASRAFSDTNFNHQMFDTYYNAFNETDQNHDIAEAKRLGYNNYDPTKLNNFVALQVLRTATPPKVHTGYSNVPRETQGRGGSGAIESKPLPTEIDPNKDYITASYNGVNKTVKKSFWGDKVIETPYSGQTKFVATNQTPFTKNFNVDLGSSNFTDLSGAGTNQTARSGTRMFKSSKLADIPYLITESGNRKYIEPKDYKQIKSSIDAGTPIHDKTSGETFVSIENVPSVVGSFMEPSNTKGEKGHIHYVAIDASNLPLNKNTKTDVNTINQYQSGGGQIKGTKTTTKAITPDRNKVAKFTFDSK